MAVLEALAREKKQAGVIVLREAVQGYVPLGVFNVRENVRNAMNTPGYEFESFKDAFSHVSKKLILSPERYIKQGRVLRSLLRPTTDQAFRLSLKKPLGNAN